MADTNELKPCPCGNIPTGLGITDGGQGGKYHYVSGDCCGEWTIEFRANYKPLESDECMALAVAAWNASPRATTPPADAALADALDRIANVGEVIDVGLIKQAAAALRARAVPSVPDDVAKDAERYRACKYAALASRSDPLLEQMADWPDVSTSEEFDIQCDRISAMLAASKKGGK